MKIYDDFYDDSGADSDRHGSCDPPYHLRTSIFMKLFFLQTVAHTKVVLFSMLYPRQKWSSSEQFVCCLESV